MNTATAKTISFKTLKKPKQNRNQYSENGVLSKIELKEIILSLAGNVSWEGNLSVQRKHRSFT